LTLCIFFVFVPAGAGCGTHGEPEGNPATVQQELGAEVILPDCDSPPTCGEWIYQGCCNEMSVLQRRTCSKVCCSAKACWTVTSEESRCRDIAPITCG
jgi:hypothetical protein